MARNGAKRVLAEAPPSEVQPVDPRLKRLLAYWSKARGDRPLPSRTDIKPSDIKFILGYVFLLDVLTESSGFRVRLQGTEMQWWVGCDLTGKTLDQLPSAEIALVAEQSIAKTIEMRGPFHKIGSQTVGDLARRYEALLLPLAQDGTTINMVMAAVVCGESPGGVPRG